MNDSNTPPIRATIENAHNDTIGGFTIPLPTSKETLQPWLEAIEAGGFRESDIAVREVRSSVPGLESVLDSFMERGIAFDELNYLAAKVQGLESWQNDLFIAAIEANLHCENIGDLINLTENISRFDLQPAFSEEQYGEFLIEMEKDNSAGLFERLEGSELLEEREFARHVLRLEEHVDAAAYGRSVAREENGVFTKYGYIALRGEFAETYHSLADIPLEHRIFTLPIMVEEADVPSFLAQLHAVVGNSSQDAERNIGVLAELRSAEYLLLMDGSGAFLTEAMHTYRQGTDAFNRWMNAVDEPETQAFSIHLTEVHGRIEGNIAEVNLAERQRDIEENSIQPIKVEATLPSGETQNYLPQEWDALEQIDRDGVQDWRRVFADGDFSKVHRHLDHLRGQTEAACRQVSASELLAAANTIYMDQAQCPQPVMLRVSQTAAKEMLARGDCEVYRLLPTGAEKLSPTDAIKSGLWFSQHRKFAIRREDTAGFQKWAGRSAADAINRTKGLEEKNKSGPER